MDHARFYGLGYVLVRLGFVSFVKFREDFMFWAWVGDYKIA